MRRKALFLLIALPFIRSHVAAAGVLFVGPRLTALISFEQLALPQCAELGVRVVPLKLQVLSLLKFMLLTAKAAASTATPAS